MKIVLGDIVFNTTEKDPFGSTWLCTALSGWENPAIGGQLVSYGTKDGSVAPPGYYNERALQIEGVCKAAGEAGFWGSYNHLQAMLGDLNATVPLVVTEGGIEKTLTGVQRASGLNMDIKPGHFTFSIPVTATDPVKYGPVQVTSITAGSTATLNNTGGYSSRNLLVTLTADGTLGLRHEGTKQVLMSGRVMDSGTDLNFLDRTVRSGDIDRYSQLSTRSAWWELRPGQNDITNTGTARVSIQYRPAWI